MISEKYYDNGIGNATEKSTGPKKKICGAITSGPRKKGVTPIPLQSESDTSERGQIRLRKRKGKESG